MLYLYKVNIKLQPFYEIKLNSIRGGFFGFIIFVCLFSIVQSIVKYNSIIMFIISVVTGIIGFFIGVYITITFYKKSVEKIFFRYKISLDINDPDMISSDDEEIDDEENSSEDNQEEQLISISEEEESEKSNDEENSVHSGSQEKSEHSSSEGSSNEEESYSEESYDFNGDDEIVLFNSIYQIAGTISLNEKMKIFPYPQSCEIACRFTRHNVSGNAMQLAIDILKKGINQYPKYIPKYNNLDEEEDFKCNAKLNKDRKPNLNIRYYYYHFTKYTLKEEKKLEEYEDK
ncbi:hypothetical protein PIROE2DRAFT_16386 [Piromyces sp. E2]|nr:hypothetical protein PIROE2DRAFT_16386 [Piromyces sp. E2]|eukprot:OUM58360.1 hypothetical protein PIROE2DRAFT_16386 [Piromyces sp. E2]